MDYKELVARVRAYTECPPLDNDALALGRWSLLDDGTEESCEVSYGDLRALCDAVEALEKDRHEGGRLVGFILDNRGKCFIADEGNYWQRDAEDFVKRAASSRAPTASTPTPAAPSDA